MFEIGDTVIYKGKVATLVGFYKSVGGDGAYIKFFNNNIPQGVLLKELQWV